MHLEGVVEKSPFVAGSVADAFGVAENPRDPADVPAVQCIHFH